MKEVKDIWQFFENMNEYVYATDIETHEIVYMNRKTLQVYGLQSLEDAKGKKCYELLQKTLIPCGMCNNDRLSVGEFEEWHYYNPIIDRYLMLKDTLIEDSANGKKYRVEIGVDISEERTQDGVIQKYQNMEFMINEGLRIALQTATPEQSIEVILEYLGNSLNGERTYIFERNERGRDDNTYEWVAEGISREKENLQDIPPEICAHWYRMFQEGKFIVFKDLEEIRESDPLQYENLKRQNIHSLVVVPLYDDGKVIAFYGVDNPPPPSLEYASNMLQIMGHFLVSCIKRRNLMSQLENVSYKDQLTKLGNRFAMEKYINEIDAEKSIGVVYCDITGLKRVNDSMGHEAGDQLILRACDSLKKAFGEYGLFRIGGDELLALCAGIEHAALMERIGLLKECMKQNNVNMAVGEIWREKYQTGLDTLLQESEKRMYADKAAYYKRTGIDRRK